MFAEQDSQQDVFAEFQPLVQQVFDGYKAILFAYGQSGSGKTHTQYGFDGNPGVMPLSLQYIFQHAQQNRLHVQVFAQFFEIYNDKLFDLLAD